MANKLKFGVNVNTRVPLIYPEHYNTDKLLELCSVAEGAGYDSLWVGDSLLAKPRLDPLLILSAAAARTTNAKVGAACMIAPLRNPVIFARSWATLDVLSKGRTLMGSCIGPGLFEYKKLGMSKVNRSLMLEEHITLTRKLWSENNVSFSGKYYKTDNISLNPKPIQKPSPPIYVVGWPFGKEGGEEVVDSVLRRVARFGDGWMVDGGAVPDLVRQGVKKLDGFARSEGKDPSKMEIVYQVTLNLNSDRERAQKEGNDFVLKYYGDLSRPITTFGPAGTAKDCIEWIEGFRSAGVGTVILRFASPDQFKQLNQFTKDVLSTF